MANEIFIDTSGFYALLIKSDSKHSAASRIVNEARRRKRTFVTTEHILDETATLLKTRGFAYLSKSFFDLLDAGRACRIEWTNPDRFGEAINYFLKHSDQEYSFTDCLSFCVMKSLRLHESLSKDIHFRMAGFTALLV